MNTMSRRRFLGALAVAIPVAVVPRQAAAASVAAGPPGASWLATGTRSLSFLHTHTGERLSLEYGRGGEYLPDALSTINHFLRDFRTGDVHAIDPRLLDVLARLTQVTGSQRPFQVISGYRSPATNDMLRHKSEGVASGSLHMQGQAIDIRLADVPLSGLRAAAFGLRAGGVGYYPASDFVHVDTGRVRFW